MDLLVELDLPKLGSVCSFLRPMTKKLEWVADVEVSKSRLGALLTVLTRGRRSCFYQMFTKRPLRM